jgi:SAM-dependent methyltransferase
VVTVADLERKYRSWRDSDFKLRKLVTWILYQTRRRRLWASVFELDRRSRFATIYKHNLWNNEESVSGAGSTLRNTLELRSQLPALFSTFGIKSIVDVGCGDFRWLSTLNLDVDYVGIDIVPDLIATNTRQYGSPRRRFQVGDVTSDSIPHADLIMCRDCLFHCSLEDAEKVMANIARSGATYLLATHCPDEKVNVDIQTGWARGLNLEIDPFRLPPPAHVIGEKWGRVMGLWRIEALPANYREKAKQNPAHVV